MRMTKNTLGQHMTVKTKACEVLACVVLVVTVYVVHVNCGFLMRDAADLTPSFGFGPRSEATHAVLAADIPGALFIARQTAVNEAALGVVTGLRFDVGQPVRRTVLIGRGDDVVVAHNAESSPKSEFALLPHPNTMEGLAVLAVDILATNLVSAISALPTEPSHHLVDGIPVDVEFAGDSGAVLEPHVSSKNQLGITPSTLWHLASEGSGPTAVM